MAKAGFQDVDQYLSAQPGPARVVLRLVRRTIRKALPGAQEVISYQIPAYRVEGLVALYFAGWTSHYSIYPATASLVATLGDALAPYELGKGTIRFRLDRPVPVRLIGRIARLRAQETAARVAARRAARTAKRRAPAKRPRPTRR